MFSVLFLVHLSETSRTSLTSGSLMNGPTPRRQAPGQRVAARALLDWPQTRASLSAGISEVTTVSLEQSSLSVVPFRSWSIESSKERRH